MPSQATMTGGTTSMFLAARCARSASAVSLRLATGAPIAAQTRSNVSGTTLTGLPKPSM